MYIILSEWFIRNGRNLYLLLMRRIMMTLINVLYRMTSKINKILEFLQYKSTPLLVTQKECSNTPPPPISF